jgi:hypothetical protein
MKVLICSLALLFCGNCCAKADWVPFVENVPVYPIVEVPTIPSVTYTNIVLQPQVVRYQWVPVYINRPIVIQQQGFFIKKQQIIYQPTVEWVIQPVYR